MNGDFPEREWLDTNDFGSYASSTVSGAHTRKYHGLLVARLSQPPGKFVLLSKIEDSLLLDGQEMLLSAHRYKGSRVPAAGIPKLEYSQAKSPTFEYRTGSVHLQKEIAIRRGASTVLIRYAAAKTPVGAKLRLKPLLAYRSYHHLSHENGFLRDRLSPADRGVSLSPYDGMPPLYLQVSGHFAFSFVPTWYRQFEYTEEALRGFECHEDLFNPGMFEIPFDKGETVILSASTEPQRDLAAAWEEEMAFRRALNKQQRGTGFQKRLKTAARQFVTTSPRGQKGITAGYHWFVEWGRDAMIALPGLLLESQDRDTYCEVLRTFAQNQQKGIIPNFLGETPQENAYNSADASLWYGWAVQQYLRHGGDPFSLGGPIAGALAESYRWYSAGTDHAIRMMNNGLLTVGAPDEQVTWMDAMVDGTPVTPRWGAPVEINALWYNFVSFIAEHGETLGVGLTREASRLKPRIKDAFNSVYWLDEEQYLADLWQGDWRDKSVRPNQIFAVSLPYSPLDDIRAKKVVAKVTAALLTPVGLRTLSPADPRYQGTYAGDPATRDRAYHNGTVWPWLLGHFGEAVLKTCDNDRQEARRVLAPCLAALEKHLDAAGIGSIAEIFDGDAPHAARGCISQAWSVAEVLRLTALIDF